MKFVRCEGGWKYKSQCGQMEIVNLSKVDGSKGWVLRDKQGEWCGTYKTLREATASAANFN